MCTSHNTPTRGQDQREALRLITAREMATLLGAKPEAVRSWARDGRVPCLRVGRRTLRFDVDGVLAAIYVASPSSRGGGA